MLRFNFNLDDWRDGRNMRSGFEGGGIEDTPALLHALHQSSEFICFKEFVGDDELDIIITSQSGLESFYGVDCDGLL